jgi:hypothetical protein
MFLSGAVLDWRIDGGRRILDKTNGTWYIVNTNRMYEITTNYNGDATMYFFDNKFDARDGGARFTIDRTVATVILAADNVITENMVTLYIYPDDDITATPVATTVPKVNVAYAKTDGYSYATDTRSWVTYVDDAWRVKTALCLTNLVVLYAELLT